MLNNYDSFRHICMLLVNLSHYVEYYRVCVHIFGYTAVTWIHVLYNTLVKMQYILIIASIITYVSIYEWF